MKKIVLLFGVSLSLWMSGCSKSDSDNNSAQAIEGSLDGVSYIVADGSGLERSDTQLSGQGKVLFKNPLGEIGSKDDFALEFQLEDGGQLELLTHTDSAGNSGVSAVITREGAVVSIAWSAGGTVSEKKALEGIDAAGVIHLAIDIHNDETPSHNLVWDGSGNSFGEEDALSNSEEDFASPGKGSGTFWGLNLSKATVLSASVSAPKFVEE